MIVTIDKAPNFSNLTNRQLLSRYGRLLIALSLANACLKSDLWLKNRMDVVRACYQQELEKRELTDVTFLIEWIKLVK